MTLKIFKILRLLLKGRSDCPFSWKKKKCLPLFIEVYIFGLSEIFLFCVARLFNPDWSKAVTQYILMRYFTVWVVTCVTPARCFFPYERSQWRDFWRCIVIAVLAILFIFNIIFENRRQVFIMKLLTRFCLFEVWILRIFFFLVDIGYEGSLNDWADCYWLNRINCKSAERF